MELRGTFQDFSLEVIFGLLRNGHKTGKLQLALVAPDGGAREVILSFAGGEIQSIQCGPLRGLDALREAAVCLEGSFEFTIDGAAGAESDDDPISMEAALAAIGAARSEMASLHAALTTTDSVLVHAFPSVDTVTISPEEFRVLAVLHDGMTINDVIATGVAPTIDTMRIVRQLIDRGLLAAGMKEVTS